MSILSRVLLPAALLLLLVLLAFSGLDPYDRTTWLLEIFPILVVLPVLVVTQGKFPLTPLLYACIFVHACVLMLGGAYTYARVPLGFWMVEVLDLHRNPYDKIGHFFQGFVPALAAREILIRGRVVRGRAMLNFIVVCIVLAVSASYELIEWAAALALGQGADEFLGTQGDPWDTQSDMFMALVGAVAAVLLFSRLHDGQIRKIRGGSGLNATIENATPADIPGLCELLNTLFSQEAEFHPDAPAQARGLAAIIGNAETGLILVARADGKMAGMVNLLFTVSTALGERVALLEDMVVAPGHRGAGLGEQLLREALARARALGCRRITLLTDAHNAAAQRFYARQGFIVSSMRPMRLML